MVSSCLQAQGFKHLLDLLTSARGYRVLAKSYFNIGALETPSPSRHHNCEAECAISASKFGTYSGSLGCDVS